MNTLRGMLILRMKEKKERDDNNLALSNALDNFFDNIIVIYQKID